MQKEWGPALGLEVSIDSSSQTASSSTHTSVEGGGKPDTVERVRSAGASERTWNEVFILSIISLARKRDRQGRQLKYVGSSPLVAGGNCFEKLQMTLPVFGVTCGHSFIFYNALFLIFYSRSLTSNGYSLQPYSAFLCSFDFSVSRKTICLWVIGVIAVNVSGETLKHAYYGAFSELPTVPSGGWMAFDEGSTGITVHHVVPSKVSAWI